LVVVDQNADDRVSPLLHAHPRLEGLHLPSQRRLPRARHRAPPTSNRGPARATPRFPISTPISSPSPTTTASTDPTSSHVSPRASRPTMVWTGSRAAPLPPTGRPTRRGATTPPSSTPRTSGTG